MPSTTKICGIEMLYQIDKLDDQIAAMKRMAILLLPYSYPQVVCENDIACLKQRELIIDGYSVVATFTRTDFQGVYLDTVSFASKYMSCLPMPIVWKIGVRFLGEKELVLSEYWREGRKFSNWTVMCGNDDLPMTNQYVKNGIDCSYNGLSFIWSTMPFDSE
jgi:hypothetical protein